MREYCRPPLRPWGMKFLLRVGSPQISQLWTRRNLRATAVAKAAYARGFGAQFELRPPFAHEGEPRSSNITRIPIDLAWATAKANSLDQTYAGSAGLRGCAGREGAIWFHCSWYWKTSALSWR